MLIGFDWIEFAQVGFANNQVRLKNTEIVFESFKEIIL
jgi:hypothetical protein